MRVAAPGLVEPLDRLEEEAAAPLPVREHVDARPRQDRAPRTDAMTDRVDGRSRAEREASEIELLEPEVGDQFPEVADEDVGRIVRRIVRLAAFPCARRSGMITRKPSLAIRSAWPNLIQFIWASENSP